MAEDTDNKYIEDFLAGSESAFNLLARKYQQKIYWHARRILGNHLDADEVTQEVLLTMYNKLRDFNGKSALFTWIYKITYTRCLNLINKRKIKKFLFLDDSDKNSLRYDTDIIEDIDNRDKLRKIDKILSTLPVKQREVFILRNFEQLSYEEIADITGKSVGGLKANYFHALKKITEALEGNE